MLSVHTSPLDQPGIGDAGGLNVYVVELSRRLAAAGVEVEVLTKAASPGQPPNVELAPGVTVRNLEAGPCADVTKEDLPAQLCALTAGVLRIEAARGPRYFDMVHSHYWLSGQVGAVASDRWDVPLVHSMHTTALVKNARLAAGDRPEPQMRIVGEQQVVASADHLIANTHAEADDLIDLYGARPDEVAVVHPGVDLDVFSPGDKAVARREVGIDEDASVLLFVGRIQPLKGPDVFVRCVAAVAARLGRGDSPRLVAVLCGGPSGPGPDLLAELRQLAAALGVADLIRFEPPQPRRGLATWYRAADLVCVPSHSESFGLVAAEAQACGTPVVAAAVGGLRTSVADGESGVLVPGHDPQRWAHALEDLLLDDQARALMGKRAREHAENFGWSATTAGTLCVYRDVLQRRASFRAGSSRLSLA